MASIPETARVPLEQLRQTLSPGGATEPATDETPGEATSEAPPEAAAETPGGLEGIVGQVEATVHNLEHQIQEGVAGVGKLLGGMLGKRE